MGPGVPALNQLQRCDPNVGIYMDAGGNRDLARAIAKKNITFIFACTHNFVAIYTFSDALDDNKLAQRSRRV